MLSSSTFLRRNGSFLRALEVTNRSRRVAIVGKIEILNPKIQMPPTVESEPNPNPNPNPNAPNSGE